MWRRRCDDCVPRRSRSAEALLDQRVVGGIGNVYRSEVLFIERVDPFDACRRRSRRMPRRAAAVDRRASCCWPTSGGGERVTMPDATGARPDASVGSVATAVADGSTVAPGVRVGDAET